MTRSSRAACAALVALTAALSACDRPTSSGGPRPATLTVRLESPRADDHALVLSLSGPEAISAVQAASGEYVVFARAAGTAARVAVFGNVKPGDVLRFTVPDGRRASEFTATVVEVIDGADAVAGQSGYRLTVLP